MPYRSSSYRRRGRKNYGYRRTARRTFRRRGSRVRRTFRRRRIGNSTVYRFARHYYIQLTAPTNSGTSQYAALAFRLNSIPGISEYQALFEEYKITKINFKFMPRQGYQNQLGQDWGTFNIWNDYDDASTPTDQEFYQKGDAKTINLSTFSRSSFNWSLRPKVLKPVYKTTGGTFGTTSSKSGWISTNAPDVDHFGTKFLWNNLLYPTATVTNPPRINILMKIYMKFRRPI